MISSSELAQRSGASYRQIDHWRGRGYLSAVVYRRGSGNPVRFFESDVTKVRVMRKVASVISNDLMKVLLPKIDNIDFANPHVRYVLITEDSVLPCADRSRFEPSSSTGWFMVVNVNES